MIILLLKFEMESEKEKEKGITQYDNNKKKKSHILLPCQWNMKVFLSRDFQPFVALLRIWEGFQNINDQKNNNDNETNFVVSRLMKQHIYYNSISVNKFKKTLKLFMWLLL